MGKSRFNFVFLKHNIKDFHRKLMLRVFYNFFFKKKGLMVLLNILKAKAYFLTKMQSLEIFSII